MSGGAGFAPMGEHLAGAGAAVAIVAVERFDQQFAGVKVDDLGVEEPTAFIDPDQVADRHADQPHRARPARACPRSTALDPDDSLGPAGAASALAMAAECVLCGATLGVLFMRELGHDARDSVACFAERSLGWQAAAMLVASFSRRR